jgi:putative transposase
MDRTVKIQLHPTPEQGQALQETLSQFTDAFNHVVAYGWQNHEKNGVKLHHATYRDTKTACPGLVSDLLIQARTKATETVKSALTWQKKQEDNNPKKVAKALKKGRNAPVFKPVKCPQVRTCPIRYNLHTYKLNWDTYQVNLASTQGRLFVPFTVPAYSAKYQGYPVATADLCYRNGKFWLHVVVSVPQPHITTTDEVIGVDLGLNHPAVASNRQFLGSPLWKEVDRRYFRLKRKLQSKGTKSAKRHLKKLAGKTLRFHRDCDHVLSKRIVQQATPGSTIVLENLSNIRETSKMGRGKQHKNVKNKRRLHSWTFAQLYAFIAYKGQERSIRVERIDPRHTSQTCSRCGYQHRSNRRSQSLFLCRKCGYCLNADLNASLNIRSKYLASYGKSLASGSPSSGLSSQPLVG